MNILLIGPQGSGKGTQAKKFIDKYGFLYFSGGDACRRAILRGGALGKQIDEIVNKQGGLVSDVLMYRLVKDFLETVDWGRGIIFDGFPRTFDQARKFDAILAGFGQKLDWAVLIDIPDELSVKRLGSRRVCVQCGAIFNILTNKPRKEGVCDYCGGKLVRRKDDEEQAIQQRLKIYHQRTERMLDFYRQKGILVKVDGSKLPQEVFEEIIGSLGLGINS